MSSRNIEENVVKMRFDNSEFDTNVEQSNETLDQFKTTITSLPENIYLGISNAISKINLSDIIGIGATLAGISLVRQGIIGIGNEIQSIAYGALNTINSVFNSAINQINEGGKQRALNIANAKFQIEGLKLSVDTFMEAADYAVSGTAYGLDAAAKVASQLGASGVTELEELKKALRGVSGVAAMANSSYEEIGHLFTVIASNGKLMTEQIRSFSSRGLNLSAELGKALNKTEKEINDMVSKGQIDFKTFYTAMDEAFGEHAKDANKTFTGAMSNVRAALSRIGEGIWTPILDNAINVFNELRLAINALKKELADNGVFTSFADHIKSIFDNASNMINLVKHAIEETAAIEQISTVLKTVFKIVDDIFDAFSFDYAFVVDEIIKNLSVIFFALNQVIMGIKLALEEVFGIRKLGGEFNSLIVWVSRLFLVLENVRMLDIKDVFVTWFKAAKDVFTTVNDILGINKDSLSKIVNNIAEAFGTFFENLKLSDDRIDKITRTFRGAASVLDIIKMFIQAIFNFVKPLFGYIPDAVDGILSISSAIGDWLYNLRNLIKEGQTFEKLFDGIKGVAIFIKDLITNIGGNFFEAFFGDEAKNETLLNKIKNFIKLIGETISQAFDNLNIEGLDLGPIQEFINNLANFGLSSGETEDAESLIDRLGKFFGKIGEGLGKIGDFFKSHIFTIFTGENETFNKFVDFTKKFGEGVGDSLTAISDFLNNTAIPEAEAIAIVALIWKAMDCIKDILIAFIQGITEIVKVLASEFGGKELLMPILDKIVDRYLGTKTLGFFDRINGFIDRFSQLKGLWSYTDNSQNEQAQIMTSIGEMLKGFAWAFVGIAAALFIIALIPADRLGPAVETLSKFVIMIAIITGILLALNKILPNFNNGLIRAFNLTVKGNGLGLMGGGNSIDNYRDPLESIGKAFTGIGIGLLALSAALYIIAKINPDNLTNATDTLVGFTLIISLVLVAFAFLSKLMADNGATIRNVGIAFTALGAGLLLLSAGIALIASAVKPEETAKLVAIGAVLAILIVVAGLMIGLCSKIASNAVNALVTAGMIFVVLGSITAMLAVLATSLIALSFVDPDKLGTVALVIGALIGVIGLFATVMLVASQAAAAPQALIALAIVAGILLALCTDLLAIGLIIGQVALVILSISEMIKNIKELLAMFKEMDDSDADQMVKNIVKVLGGIALAIPAAFEMYYDESTKSVVKLFPRILSFITTQLIPFIDKLFGIVIPNLVENAILAIQTLMDSIRNYMPNVFDIFDNLMFSGGGILIFIFGILDKMWNDTVEWMEGRIPVWVADIMTLLLILITAINAAFEDNWDEFDKQIQLFIDHTLSFLTDLLTNEKTKDDLSELVGGIFSRIAQIVEENKDLIQEAFASIGRVMGSALLGGLAETMPDNAIGDWISGMLQNGADSMNQTSVGNLNPARGSSLVNGYSDISSYSGIDLSDMTGIDTGTLNKFLGVGNVNALANQTTSNDASSNSKPKDLNLNLTVDATPNTRYTFKQMNFHTNNQRKSGSIRVFGG